MERTLKSRVAYGSVVALLKAPSAPVVKSSLGDATVLEWDRRMKSAEFAGFWSPCPSPFV